MSTAAGASPIEAAESSENRAGRQSGAARMAGTGRRGIQGRLTAGCEEEGERREQELFV
jgi:hypothetical protein